jgi:hypothetical protein
MEEGRKLAVSSEASAAEVRFLLHEQMQSAEVSDIAASGGKGPDFEKIAINAIILTIQTCCLQTELSTLTLYEGYYPWEQDVS